MNARRLAPLTLMLSALACAGGAERDRDPGITDADGGVSSGQDSGQSDAGAGVDAGPNPSGDVGRYQVHEITVTASNDGFRNVWEDAQLQARLTAPSGAMVTVPGFYYDANTWKIRYAPSEVGAYTYSYTLSGPAGTVSEGSGRFVVYESSEQGFLRQHSSNPYRMVFERTGALFTGQGFSGCLRDPESQTFPTPWEDKGFCIDKYRATDADACGKTYDQYMNVYADQMKPAVYRWNVNACSFPLWNQIDTTFPNGVATPNNYYNVTWGKWGDKVVRDLRRRGIRILMSPVGFGWQRAPYGNRCGPNNDQDCTTSVCGEHADMPCTAHNAAVVDTNDVQGLMRYYTYIVARYGGEEFAIVLLDTDAAGGLAFAETLAEVVRETDFPGAETQPLGRLSVSIGVATFPSDAADRAQLIRRADAALYEAKRQGRDRVVRWHEGLVEGSLEARPFAHEEEP
ncbi:MAG: diguanylate cyclase [Myxococcales bacterium]|nr:diguanylate cyclase [Myxococcales bacterium]